MRGEGSQEEYVKFFEQYISDKFVRAKEIYLNPIFGQGLNANINKEMTSQMKSKGFKHYVQVNIPHEIKQN